MGEVVRMPPIPLKTEKFRINNQHEVKLVFEPHNRPNEQWRWELTIWRQEFYCGFAKTIDMARLRARAVCDTALGGVQRA